MLLYEVAGPLFFGAAQKAMSALHRVPTGVKVVLLDLSSVPAMDATGLVSLESAVERLQALGVYVVLAGVQSQPLRVLAKADIHAGRTGSRCSRRWTRRWPRRGSGGIAPQCSAGSPRIPISSSRCLSSSSGVLASSTRRRNGSVFEGRTLAHQSG